MYAHIQEHLTTSLLHRAFQAISIKNGVLSFVRRSDHFFLSYVKSMASLPSWILLGRDSVYLLSLAPAIPLAVGELLPVLLFPIYNNKNGTGGGNNP
jgi:hypothetical protein